MVGGCIATGVVGVIASWDIETSGGDGAVGGSFVASKMVIGTSDGTKILVLPTAEKSSGYIPHVLKALKTIFLFETVALYTSLNVSPNDFLVMTSFSALFLTASR
ncbi:hypothetical protein PoB_003539900 [Plakobranchus ocellatus]|uniref:Uncharacterized protein n=1 Tax=Plakobranchus ocellatus TaxID=259542 RepID=A0AAV4ARY7_9GAST|nr:hypothetical protein PoB_003539900 [Plakobranchus ocellatus]